MLRYKVLPISEGPNYMQHVWNLVFKPLEDCNFFVQPCNRGVLTDYADFSLNHEGGPSSGIYFFVDDNELVDLLRRTKGQLYLYGAYNQVNVCQMRARGSVICEVGNPQTASIRENMRTRITTKIGSTYNAVFPRAEAMERFKVLDDGQLFRFRAVEYAFAGYQRG